MELNNSKVEKIDQNKVAGFNLKGVNKKTLKKSNLIINAKETKLISSPQEAIVLLEIFFCFNEIRLNSKLNLINELQLVSI